MIRLLASLGLAAMVAAAPAFAQAPAATPAPSANRTAPATRARPAAAPAAAPVTAPAGATDGKKVDVNAASQAELEVLPGVGPVRAKAIIAGRPYDSIDALAAKKALPAATLAKLRPQVALANINTSTAKDMQLTLPGIGDARAGQIVAGRPYATPADLVSKGVLTQALFDRIKDLVAY